MLQNISRFSPRHWMLAAATTASGMLAMSLSYTAVPSLPAETILESELTLKEEAEVFELFSEKIVPQFQQHYRTIMKMSEVSE